MYSKLKKLIFNIIPANILINYEFFLRRFYSLFFIGHKVYCNICNKHFSNFIAVHKEDKLCPRCGSIDRQRRLWKIIRQEITVNQDDLILDFSPSRKIAKKMKKEFPGYLTTDFNKTSAVDRNYNIKAIDEPSNKFNLIICYHILEHIDDDIKAMSELLRILKKGGTVLIQTPFKVGDIYENSTITSENDRQKHFGQADHVRIYSVNGLEERLLSVGFTVRIAAYSDELNNINGFKPMEYVFFASKSI